MVCPHAEVVTARTLLLSNVPARIEELAVRLLVASARASAGTWRFTAAAAYSAAKARAASFRNAAASTDWAGTDGRFVLFRLLLALPWPAAVPAAHPHPLPLACMLGALFDETCVPHINLHVLANVWVRWAGRACDGILRAWATGVQNAWLAAGGGAGEGACYANPLPQHLPAHFLDVCGRGEEEEEAHALPLAAAASPPRVRHGRHRAARPATSAPAVEGAGAAAGAAAPVGAPP
jgi:hypothetical protein